MFRRLLWRPEAAFFLLCFAAVSARFRDRAFNDPGAMWHVKVGELILSDGFMRTDPFTFTFTGKTWIPQQWGGEVAMAAAHAIGGFDGVLLGFSVFVAGLFTWLFARAVRDGMHPLLAGIVIGGAAVVSAFHFYARPHMATLAGMAITMAVIMDYQRGRAGPWSLWALIPLFAVWTNIHGGVLGGTVTLGMAVCIWLCPPLPWGRGVRGEGESSHLPSLRGGRREAAGGEISPDKTPLPVAAQPTSPQRGEVFQTPTVPGCHATTSFPLTPNPSPPGERGTRDRLFLLAVLTACVLTPFVNPFGMEMIRTWRKIVGSPAMAELVSEHQPLSIHHTAGQVVVGFAAFYAFILFGVNPRNWKLVWLLPAVWFLLTLKGIRQGPLFAVTAAVVIADAWASTKWYALIKKHGDTLATEPSETPRGWGWLALPAVLLAVGWGMQANGANAPFVGRGWATLNRYAWPVELTDELQRYAASVPAGTPIYNDANLGGFVLYHAPTLKIFMDDRFELYGDRWIRDYVDVVYEHPERFDEWAKEYGFVMALLVAEPEPTPLELYLLKSQSWVEVARCERGVLFRKR